MRRAPRCLDADRVVCTFEVPLWQTGCVARAEIRHLPFLEEPVSLRTTRFLRCTQHIAFHPHPTTRICTCTLTVHPDPHPSMRAYSACTTNSAFE